MAPGFNKLDSFLRLSPIPSFGEVKGGGDFPVNCGFLGVAVKSNGAAD